MRLIPRDLAYLIEDRPLLWYEDGDDYEMLLSSVFAELDPKGAIETILVKDVADYIWEARRLRRLKAAALHAETPGNLAKLARDTYQREHGLDYHSAQSFLTDAGRAGVAGDEEDAEQLSQILSSTNITADVLTYEAYKSSLKTMAAITTELERLERRRDQILRALNDRRAAIGAMARSLMAREEADTITLPETDGGAQEAAS